VPRTIPGATVKFQVDKDKRPASDPMHLHCNCTIDAVSILVRLVMRQTHSPKKPFTIFVLAENDAQNPSPQTLQPKSYIRAVDHDSQSVDGRCQCRAPTGPPPVRALHSKQTYVDFCLVKVFPNEAGQMMRTVTDEPDLPASSHHQHQLERTNIPEAQNQSSQSHSPTHIGKPLKVLSIRLKSWLNWREEDYAAIRVSALDFESPILNVVIWFRPTYISYLRNTWRLFFPSTNSLIQLKSIWCRHW
jgi:hypothetical protein